MAAIKALTVTVSAGCVSTPASNSPSTAVPCDEGPSEWLRGRAAAASVEHTVRDHPGYETDQIEYFPENETIRLVTDVGADGDRGYDTWSLEGWGSEQAASAAAERAQERVTEALDTRAIEFSTSSPPVPGASVETDEAVAHLSLQCVDGTFPLALSDVADAAPRSVDATISIRGDTVSRTVPVFVSVVPFIHAH